MVVMKVRATLQCSAQQSACVHDLQVADARLSSSLHSRHLLADSPPAQPTTDSPTWTLPSLDQVSPVMEIIYSAAATSVHDDTDIECMGFSGASLGVAV